MVQWSQAIQLESALHLIKCYLDKQTPTSFEKTSEAYKQPQKFLTYIP